MKQKIHGLLGTLHPLARAGAILFGISMALGVLGNVADAQQHFAPIDHVLLSLRGQSRSWMHHMLGPARNLAMSLGLIQFAWSAIKMGLSPNMGLQSAIELLFKQLMFVGFAIALIQLAPTWMPAIVESVQELGRGATGRATPMTPQRVLQVGVQLFVLVYQDLSAINPLEMLPIAGCLIILFCLYMLLACMMALAIAQVYLVMGAGVFLLGFQGSTWTQDLARGYLRYLLAAGVKLMVVTLIVSVGEAQVTVWLSLAQGDNGLGGSVEILLVAMSSVAVITVMVITLPEYAAAMITGSTGFAGDGMVVAAAMMGANAAAGAASGAGSAAAAAALGAGAGSGPASAVESAANVGRNAGGSAAPSGAPSGPVVSGGAGYPDFESDGEGAEGFLGPLDEDADAAESQGSPEADTPGPDAGQPPPSSADSESLESAPGSAGGTTTAAEGASASSAAGDRSSSHSGPAGHSGSGRMKGGAGVGGGAKRLGGLAAAARGGGGGAAGDDVAEEDDDE